MEQIDSELEPTKNNNELMITKLKALVAFLEKYPELPTAETGCDIWLYLSDATEFLEAIKGKGNFVKNFYGDQLHMEHHFGDENSWPQVKVSFVVQRELICTRREVQEVIPAQAERTVTRTKWDCPDSVLQKLDNAAAIEQGQKSLPEPSNV